MNTKTFIIILNQYQTASLSGKITESLLIWGKMSLFVNIKLFQNNYPTNNQPFGVGFTNCEHMVKTETEHHSAHLLKNSFEVDQKVRNRYN